MTPLLQVDRARVSSSPGGPVEVDDPECPWLVRVWTATAGGRSYITGLHVSLHPAPDHVAVASAITAARLARLPVAQLLHVASAHTHPSEVYWRMAARPRRPGHRSWDDDHWAQVLAVWQWAVDTARPGGPRQAVADLWGVSVDPTVDRWLARARALTDQEEVVVA